MGILFTHTVTLRLENFRGRGSGGILEEYRYSWGRDCHGSGLRAIDTLLRYVLQRFREVFDIPHRSERSPVL